MNVDDEGYVTEEDAIEWLRREYGLSHGAARAEMKKAFDSGNVDWAIPPQLNYLLAASLVIFGSTCIDDDRFVHDLRLNLDDLKWQIEQQLGKPPAEKVPKRKPKKPDQDMVNGWLLNRARRSPHHKLKQKDRPLFQEAKLEIGATDPQVKEAFKDLPPKHRYGRGAPPKSRK